MYHRGSDTHPTRDMCVYIYIYVYMYVSSCDPILSVLILIYSYLGKIRDLRS